MKIQELITEGLSLPKDAIAYHVGQDIAAIYPKKVLLESSDSSFNLENYAGANLCNIQEYPDIHNPIITGWNGMHNNVYEYRENGCFEVTWQGNKFDVILMSWRQGSWKNRYYWILADSKELAKNFFAAVCEWNSEIRNEILVFANGCWNKNPDFFKSIKKANFEDIILHSNLKQEIQDDLIKFFASEKTYANHNIPWKRGILLIGSPGNGKTKTIKALINRMGLPCLYVKNFRDRYANDSENIQKVFKQARQSAPCILILEDIDSLLTGENRSFLLNELDGFANNQGIMTIATTNYPEHLDASIIKRPSRFDRRFYFELPEAQERQAYIALENSKLETKMRLSDEALSQIVVLTDGFSFAYLQELFISSIMRWIGVMETGAMDTIMRSEVAALQEQMSSTNVYD